MIQLKILFVIRDKKMKMKGYVNVENIWENVDDRLYIYIYINDGLINLCTLKGYLVYKNDEW
jgi:hypothetical protein